MKIFYKEKFASGQRNIYFCGVKIYSYTPSEYRNIKIWKNKFCHILKYKYVLDAVPETKIIDGYSDCIWQLWFQGENNAPEIVKKCISSVKKYCREYNKKYVLLTEENIFDYVKVPDFMLEKYKAGIFSKTNFSDYIRLLLLSQYGGTWIDATVLLTGPIPTEIYQQDFFQFKNLPWLNLQNQKVPTEEQLHAIAEFYPRNNVYISGSSWFIHAKPNCVLINATLKIWEEYWKNENKLIDYFLFHYILTFVIVNNKEAGKIFNKSLSLWNGERLMRLAGMLLWRIDEAKFAAITEFAPIHKLTYKYDFTQSKKSSISDFCLNCR